MTDRRQPDQPASKALAVRSPRRAPTGRVPIRSLLSGEMAVVPPSRARRLRQGGIARVRDWTLDHEILGGVAWQTEAWTYYRIIAQIRKVINLKANTLAACRERPKVIDPETGEAVDTDDERVLRVWGALKGPTGGKRELLRKYSILMDVGGEAFLVGEPQLDLVAAEAAEARGDSPELSWEFLSRQEIRGDRPSITAQRGVIFRDSAGVLSLSRRPVPGSALIARDHTPDGQFTELPDSAMRSVIPDASEYVQLREVVTGAIRQRMSAGILLIPDTDQDGPIDETLDLEADYDDEVDPFLADLEVHMGAPVVDRTDPAAYVPLIFKGHPDDLEQVRMVDLGFATRNIEWATPLRQEKLLMIAQGLDATPEALEGMSQLNHWTGYMVLNEMASRWVIPRGEQLAEFLTTEYLRPMLEEFEGMSQEEAAQFVVVFDASNITARADKGVTWIRLYDRGLVSGRSTVEANGGTVDDMPDEKERAQRLAFDLVLRFPELLPAFVATLGLSEIDADLDAIAAAIAVRSDGGGGGTPLDAVPDADGDEEEPEEDVETDDPGSGGGEAPSDGPMEGRPRASLERLIRDLTISANAAGRRAVEKATSKVMGLAETKRDTTVPDLMRNRSSEQLLMLVTDDDLERLGTTPEALIHGAWDAWGREASAWISRCLSDELGVSQRDIGDRTRFLVDELQSLLQSALLDSGGDPRHDGMIFDEEMIRETVEVEMGHLLAAV